NVKAGDVDAMTAWQLNASYDFEVAKLSLAYGQDRNGKLGWNGTAGSYSGLSSPFGDTSDASKPATVFDSRLDNGYQDFKSNNYHVGVRAPLAGGTLYAGWNYSTSNLDDSSKWDDKADNISAYQVNYVYPLSKRTSLYTYASYMKNVGYVKD